MPYSGPLVKDMILKSDNNGRCFRIVQKNQDSNNTLLIKVKRSASGGYKDRKNATYLYEADNNLRAQYSIIPQ